jgi:hypothetical protein
LTIPHLIYVCISNRSLIHLFTHFSFSLFHAYLPFPPLISA